MKDQLTDANFPRTADNRVYHLGLRPGEIANRAVTVGSPSRAQAISKHLDSQPRPFRLESERGFITITGRYKGKYKLFGAYPSSSYEPRRSGLYRRHRESITGDMAIIRLGSCGSLDHLVAPVGTVVVPKACVAITRNLDFDFGNSQQDEKPYFISKPVVDDLHLHQIVRSSLAFPPVSSTLPKVISALENARPPGDKTSIVGDKVNASADSFYSSQGRLTSFPDHNDNLVEELLQQVDDLGTLEMETHHLYHLAKCWNCRPKYSPGSDGSRLSPPLTTGPVQPRAMYSGQSSGSAHVITQDSRIYVSAAHMVFAARTSENRDFITPDKVQAIEEWGGKLYQGILEALIAYDIPTEASSSSSRERKRLGVEIDG
ncbi:hypothetical protein D9757_003035 [Collybiopsis confluens]|uniref:Nucleoside phosphorylase domain-containing protein n=1 Tax=Collybiopsis confluens TaxID=2823264 RepID=A0A8H5HXE9_9AGAR|nr:hypothetical protein D9757_003035 [Collybiopsis confluens]